MPVNGRDRHRLGNGTGATKSGFGRPELGPHELYAARWPLSCTAPTATTAAQSAGQAMLPFAVEYDRPPPSTTRWNGPAGPRLRRTRTS